MNFDEALKACKNGAKITRADWNDKNQFAYYQQGSVMSVDSCRNKVLKDYMTKNNISEIEICGHFDFKTMDNRVQCGWFGIESDIRADDWEIVA